MDDLEFRRRVIAQPHNEEQDIADYAKQDPEHQQFIEQMQELDDSLTQALDIPVPKGLADRILANTPEFNDEYNTPSNESQVNEAAEDNVINAQSRFKLGGTPLAMAASLLVAIGAFFFTSSEHNVAYGAGEHALTHIYHEINSLEKTNEISLQTVNEKFAELGGKLDELPGKVTYLMFCDFKGQRGLHLVFESDYGPMTVFIVPSKAQSFGIGDNDFSDQRFAGHIDRGPDADTILVASLGAPVDQYTSRINSAIRWLH
ncbi:MAG: DUF3379 family protein [Pseudoalteromonas sp.]|uniref:DUF3379 family protein n=1 Tax=unclassified Pseudoalteromonas TaxID=194690 RepID=UPI000C068FD5|nr:MULTISPECIES: DUF3379 family protein [unclassified Pseudoalteromonas]MDP2633929.1 DUF3379 family protein [Pseudoalteromonas sp. 1_MG-2023]PHN88629.1 hypothetical protein CSC79_16735 [Pseudoalteromonas sp. 3D05]TGE78243.1 DUF3379 domain-containing protein [Pseudoalteromonas sp. KS88]